MQTKVMMNNVDSTFMTMITIFLYALFVITIQSVAGICAIIAAISTFILNVYKFRELLKDKNKPKQNE